ncbi:MAG: IS5 family transposase [Mogibacterium sp.]|nr:IS5 family transposase [Mogibacterium sp.]
MYKKNRNKQLAFEHFDQPLGLKLNPDNRWVKKAETIPWDAIEERYAKLFPSNRGVPAKPLRMAFGSLLLQKHLGCSDRELVEQITENPYFQYFIGLPGYQMEAPYVPSLLVEFRKRLTEDILGDINDMILEYNTPDDHDDGDDSGNSGTLILDATCAPQNIEYPQDINLLNQCREDLEGIVDEICYSYNLKKPRMYRVNARKEYLSLAKCKKRTGKKIRKALKAQLQYVRRDLRYVDEFIAQSLELEQKQLDRIETIRKVYEQQDYMYCNNTHVVSGRIVSISQPYVRPIIRGKAKAPTEFGAKLDISLDNGLARIEKLSFDPYNESEVLISAVENYHKRHGHYPERVLVDQIYRKRKNISYCKMRGIRISGPALGRPKKDPRSDKKIEYRDAVDRIEVERAFSLAKRSFGLGLITTKLETTTRSSIVLSIIAMNVDRLTKEAMRFLLSIFQGTYVGLSFEPTFLTMVY